MPNKIVALPLFLLCFLGLPPNAAALSDDETVSSSTDG